MASLYTLPDVLAIVKSRADHIWQSADIKSLALKDCHALYRSVEVPIDDVFGKQFTLYLKDYEFETRLSDLTLQEWLDSRGEEALKLTDGYPTLELREITYMPGTFKKGKFELAKRGYHPSHDVTLEDYDDVIINYDGVTPESLHKYALWSVGGFHLPSTWHGYGVRVLHGGDIIRKSSDMDFGFINFEQAGALTQIPITESMVHKLDDSLTFYDKCLIDAGVNLFDKTVGIVIGGYLHLLDGMVNVIGSTTFTISLKNFNYVERVIESQEYLDLDFMELEDVDNNAVVSKIRDDKNMLEYLTCPYSFIVLIDNPEITKTNHGVDRASALGKFIIEGDRTLGRLTTQWGRGIDYWANYECGKWSLNTTLTHLPTYAFKYAPWESEIRINDAAIGIKPVEEVQPDMTYYFARHK